MRRSHTHKAWFKILACCFIVVAEVCAAVVCTAMAIILANVNGEDGADGKEGITITSVDKTTDGNVDTYTVNYSDGTSYAFTVTNASQGDEGVGITDVTVNDDGTITLTYSGNAEGTTAEDSSGTTVYTKTIDNVTGVSEMFRDGRYLYVVSSDSDYNTTAYSGSAHTDINYYYTVDLCCVHDWNLLSDLTDEEKNYFNSADLELKNTTADCENIGVTYYFCPDCGAIKTVITAAAGHTYDTTNITWSWTADYSYATATFACTKCNHTETVVAVISSESTATCTEDGSTTYKATVTFGDSSYTDKKEITTLATGHNYVASWTWTGNDTDGYTAAELTLTCNNDSSHTQKYTASLNTEVTAVSCTTDGTTVYTATYTTTEGETYTDTKTVTTAAAAGHSYGEEVKIYNDGCTMVYASVCGVCGDIKYNTGSLLFTLSEDDNSYTVSRGTYTGANVVIPSTYNGLSVTAVGDLADSTYVNSSANTVSLKVSSAKSAAKTAASLTANSVSTLTYAPLESVTIPSSVTTIAEGAFAGCTKITEIIVPDSVTTIGLGAFYGCSGLTSITLPFVGGVANTSESGSNAQYNFGYIFGGSDYSGRNDNGKCVPLSLKTVIITGAAESIIDQYAFKNTAVENVTIGGNITTIVKEAFAGVSSLTQVTFSNGCTITTIENGAFKETGLTTITIPDSVTSLKQNSFEGCASLTTVTLGTGVTEISQKVFLDCSLLSSVTINGSVIEINASAFQNCTSLETFTVPSTVEDINNKAFSGCVKLSNISIPAAVATIQDSAFAGCSTLATVTFDAGSSSLKIGEKVFENCTALTSITIPDRTTEIGSGAFLGCSALTSITLPFVGGSASATTASASTLFGYIFGTESYNGSTATTQKYSSEDSATYYIPDSLATVTITGGSGEKILYGAFYGCANITTVTLDSGVKSMGSNIFYQCSELKTVEIKSTSVTSIGSGTFYECISLICVNIPASVTSIGNNAFCRCKSLANITLPSGLTSLGAYAFRYCSALLSISISNGVETINKNTFEECTSLATVTFEDTSKVTSIGANAFRGCTALTSISLPSALTTISQHAFRESGLTKITIPDSVTTIESNAFRECESLATVTIGKGVTNLYYNSFYYCKYITAINYNAVNATVISDVNSYQVFPNGGISADGITVTIGAAVQNIPAHLFNGYAERAKITSIVFESGSVCESIGEQAFKDCDYLTTIEYNGITTLKTIGNYAFRYCDGFTSITIPDCVTTIGEYAFECCNKLESVTIGSGVTEICEHAFSSCYSLAEVNFKTGTGDLTIGESAFRYSRLKKIVIPDNAVKICVFAFSECSSLESVTIGKNVTQIGTYAFRYCRKLTEIIYNAASATLYTEIDPTNSSLSYMDYCLFEDAGINSTGITVTIGADVTTLPENLFYRNNNIMKITKVVFAENCSAAISGSAFGNNYWLTSVVIRSGCDINFKGNSFRSCYSLVEVYNLSSEITITAGNNDQGYLGYYAKVVHTSANDESILIVDDDYTFCSYEGSYYLVSYTGSETSITLPSTISSVSQNYEINQYAFYFRTSLQSVEIPSCVTAVGAYAFGGSGITTLTFAETNLLTSIGERAFWLCESLTSVTIPDSVTTVGDFAFAYCKAVKTITIGSGVTSIGAYAFTYTSITTITIPDSVTTIGKRAFEECESLAAVTIGSGLTTLTEALFSDCTALTTLTLGVSVTTIETNVFANCPLTTINLNGNSNYLIENNTLYNSSKTELVKYYGTETTFTVPDSVTVIAANAFQSSTTLTSVILGNSVTTIGDYAFENCSALTSVTLGSGVTSIGNYAFYGCTSLKSVYYSGTASQWASISFGERTSNPLGYGGSLYLNNTLATDITIENITSIKANAFYGCTSLTSIKIGSGVTSIGSSAFYGCTSLTSVTIGSGVTSIDNNAFYGCKSLTSIIIPSSVKKIGRYTFYECTALTSITFSNTSGWYVTTTFEATSGKNVTVDTAETNATNLTIKYVKYYWYRSE